MQAHAPIASELQYIGVGRRIFNMDQAATITWLGDAPTASLAVFVAYRMVVNLVAELKSIHGSLRFAPLPSKTGGAYMGKGGL
jgi:hypothetical protein